MISVDLLNRKFHIELLDLKDRHYDIAYHASINKDANSITRIQPQLETSFDLFNTINLPIALKAQDGKKYELVARYWVLQYLTEHHEKIDKFPAIIFEDENLVPKILELEKLENDYFLRKETAPDLAKPRPIKSGGKLKSSLKKQPASKHRSTDRRRAAKATGRTCPFCPGPLVKATGEYKDSQGVLTQDGPNKILCGYRKISRYNCSFFATLTDAENDDFTNKDMSYPTSEWLKLTPDRKCPDCGADVYTRTRHNLNGTVEEQDRCRKNHQTNDNACCWSTLWRAVKSEHL